MENPNTNSNSVEIGFLVSPEDNWQVWDSAKFGGKPRWLIPTDIPSLDVITCKECGKPMCFLCQLYNPCNDFPYAYHRCIYLFVCRNQKCLEMGSMKVLRCQLPKKNSFYPEDVTSICKDGYYDPSCLYSPFRYGNHLCSVCGIKATSRCSHCNAFYCCRDHQVIAWKNGHKESCGKTTDLASLYKDSHVYPTVQFPLWEVDILPEREATEDEIASEVAERERLNRFEVTDEPICNTLSELIS